jgi:hypothetical protein
MPPVGPFRDHERRRDDEIRQQRCPQPLIR